MAQGPHHWDKRLANRQSSCSVWPLSDRQFGMGYGAIFFYLSSLFLFSIGVAERRGTYGDKFVISMIIFVILLVVIFIFYPIFKLFVLRVYR